MSQSSFGSKEMRPALKRRDNQETSLERTHMLELGDNVSVSILKDIKENMLIITEN